MKITVLLPRGNLEEFLIELKNPLNGKPLFHAIIEAELDKSKYINKVIINTDNKLISDSAISVIFKGFVHIHKRPKKIQGDFVL